MHLLPRGPKTVPFAALFSTLGALIALDVVVGMPDGVNTPGIVIVLLIFGIVQMLVAIVAVLLDQGLITLPSPKPRQPHAQGQPQGQYGQGAGPFGQGQYGQPPSGPVQQQAPHGGPGQPPIQQPQPTQYAAHQGQFYQRQEPGQQSAGQQQNTGQQQNIGQEQNSQERGGGAQGS
jgi:hypothetical protein